MQVKQREMTLAQQVAAADAKLKAAAISEVRTLVRECGHACMHTCVHLCVYACDFARKNDNELLKNPQSLFNSKMIYFRPN